MTTLHISPLTDKQRIDGYEWVIVKLEKAKESHFSVCAYLSMFLGLIKIRLNDSELLNYFPEFKKKRPLFARRKNYWWADGNYKIRIKKLKECIQEIKNKKP